MTPSIDPAAARDERARRLDFVEVRADGPSLADHTGAALPGPLVTAVEPRWNLWGDLDR
jgi:hypothetical protein